MLPCCRKNRSVVDCIQRFEATLSAIKKITLDHAKQMVIAILDREHLLSYASAAEAAVDFPVAFAASSGRSRRQQVRRKRPFQNARVRGHALPLCLSFPDSMRASRRTRSWTASSQHAQRPGFPFRDTHPSVGRDGADCALQSARQPCYQLRQAPPRLYIKSSPRIASQTWYAVLRLGDTGA